MASWGLTLYDTRFLASSTASRARMTPRSPSFRAAASISSAASALTATPGIPLTTVKQSRSQLSATRFQPVWVQDVAQAVVHCLQNPDTAGQIFDVCGPAGATGTTSW